MGRLKASLCRGDIWELEGKLEEEKLRRNYPQVNLEEAQDWSFQMSGQSSHQKMISTCWLSWRFYSQRLQHHVKEYLEEWGSRSAWQEVGYSSNKVDYSHQQSSLTLKNVKDHFECKSRNFAAYIVPLHRTPPRFPWPFLSRM